jgi:hypothetical protein
MKELIELERKGWEALTEEGESGRKFYGTVLRDDAVMLFPGGLRIAGRENSLQSFGSQPWDEFQMEDAEVLSLGEDAAAVVYKVTAIRKGTRPYVALISSTYFRDQTWQLVLHQQTLE